MTTPSIQFVKGTNDQGEVVPIVLWRCDVCGWPNRGHVAYCTACRERQEAYAEATQKVAP